MYSQYSAVQYSTACTDETDCMLLLGEGWVEEGWVGRGEVAA